MQPFWTELLLRLPTTALTAVVSFFVYLALAHWWQRLVSRRLRRLADAHARRHQGLREAALLLSVVTDPRSAALAHLAGLGKQTMPVFQVHRADGLGNDGADWYAFLEGVKREVRAVRAEGFQRLHLFCSTPVALALMAGMTLANGPEVVVYHFASNRYVEVGRLVVETVRV